MKKKILMVLLVCLLLSSCKLQKQAVDLNMMEELSGNVLKLSYSSLIIVKSSNDFIWSSNELKDEELTKSKIDKNEELQGYNIVLEDQEKFWIWVGIGERPTQDHGFEIKDVELVTQNNNSTDAEMVIYYQEINEAMDIGNRKLETSSTELIEISKKNIPSEVEIKKISLIEN